MKEYADLELTNLLPERDFNTKDCSYWYSVRKILYFDQKFEPSTIIDNFIILQARPCIIANNIVLTDGFGKIIVKGQNFTAAIYSNSYINLVAWSWEDIREYLLTKNLFYTIEFDAVYKTLYVGKIYNSGELVSVTAINNSYEYLRVITIKKCLELILN